MENSIKDMAKNKCCGCGACVQKCPKNAITLVEDEEGFFYPTINIKKCINCGLCKKVCPFINYNENEKKGFPKAYAMKNKNKKDLLKSSSGGIFSVLAKYVLNQNGVVFGAAYDSKKRVNHIYIEDEKDLYKLQGSKYVQSNILNTFVETKRFLDSNRLVLFSGTPCQIKGLKNFLSKEYDNLITCDLVCHGVPSQKLFLKYLSYLSKKNNKNIKSYEFRNKEKKGWGLTAKVVLENSRSKFINSDFDPYYSNFLDCNTYRESCYNCKFASTIRTSDITLADYWGVLSIHNNFYDKNGVSLVLVNTTKGLELLDSFKEKVEFIETNLDYAISKNKNLKQPSVRPAKRDNIYKNIDILNNDNYIKSELPYKITIKKIVKLFIQKKKKKILAKVVVKKSD